MNSYKDSGVPWFGIVPNHWDVLRLGALLKERGEVNRGRKTENILSVMRDVGVINYEDKGNVGNKKSEDIERYKIVREGDIVVNSMNVIIGSVGIAKENGALSPVYLVFRAADDSVSTKYYNYIFMVKPFQRSLVRIGYGILDHRMRIPVTLLRQELLPKPPRAEQEFIVAYLDTKLADIDRYIAEKERLIELLQEQKIALINQAVTRGVNQKVKMKVSGIEWLNGVPAHWEERKISSMAKVGNGSTPSRSNNAYWNNGIFPWLNSSHVNQGVITEGGELVSEQALKECHLPIVPPNSILVGITGQGKTRGMSALLTFEATINQHIAYITLKNNVHISPRYLNLVLAGFYPYLRAISDGEGSTKGALTCEDIKHFKLPLPPVEEQKEILEYVDISTKTIRNAIADTEKQIEIIQEYRTALIAEAVTGKIDVRS